MFQVQNVLFVSFRKLQTTPVIIQVYRNKFYNYTFIPSKFVSKGLDPIESIHTPFALVSKIFSISSILPSVSSVFLLFSTSILDLSGIHIFRITE